MLLVQIFLDKIVQIINYKDSPGLTKILLRIKNEISLLDEIDLIIPMILFWMFLKRKPDHRVICK